MSDQFAIGLLVQMVEQMRAQIESLTERVEALEAGEDEGPQYLDGSK